MNRQRKRTAVLAVTTLLVALGVSNIYLKATWHLLDDGVLWKEAAHGVVASRISSNGPAAAAGIETGDVLLGIDGQEVLTVSEIRDLLVRRTAGDRLTYSLLRAEARRSIEVKVLPLPTGNVTLFYFLSLVGFFSLAVGTVVMMRRPSDYAAAHFYGICILFFLRYSTSYTGKLDGLDWALLWTDHLAALFLPAAFFHFCLSFPEQRLPRHRRWLVPAAYAPAFLLGAATAVSQVLFATTGADVLWSITAAIDRLKPTYFAVFLVVSFLVLVHSYRSSASLLARKQMKWLVWGTGAGTFPYLVFDALPFALGQQMPAAGELAGNIPLALIPLSLAYAVVQHRLMDVELIVRRTLISVLATTAIVGVTLLAQGLLGVVVGGDQDPHWALTGILSTVVVMLLFPPIKSRVQETIDRLFLRERYASRRALLRLSHELNAELDLTRMTERLLEGAAAALGVESLAVLLRERDGTYSVFRGIGQPKQAEGSRLQASAGALERFAEGRVVHADSSASAFPAAAQLGLAHCFPCRVKGDSIAVLAVGERAGFDPLNSEELEILQALAGQAATAITNGRLYQSLQAKAEELQRLTDYNESILESIDSGIVVLGLDGRIARWNQAMEMLYGRRRSDALRRALEDVFPEAFLEALRGSLVLGEQEEIAHIYKLHLPTPDGRSLIVNVSIAPFEVGSGERWGTILIVEDVTARVRLEEQLQHSDKMASIGLLAAGVAHEVNTPLAGISSYTQILREQVPSSDARAGLLDKIEKQTFRAAKIVNSLLNFARSGSGELQPLDMNKLVLDVLSLLEHQLEKARVMVRKELADDLPPVRGNESRLQQVFFNLVINARDAMPSGGWLTLRTRLDDDDTLVVEVGDTGQGIRREDIRRIYDPFFTTKGTGRGTGLGLSVSYGIVQEHGGAIFVESAPGKGTTFQVALPPLRILEAAER
jgi:two-component system, NtrC family, sensor kinase